MLLVNPVGVGVVGYFLDGRDPGRWSPGAGRLLGLEGPVDRLDLVAVLRGRHPGSGQFLPAARRARRRAGWDLIFAAPKSVSLVAATSGSFGDVPARNPAATGGLDPTVAGAHEAAVEGVLAWLDRRLTVAHHATAATGDGGRAHGAGPFAAADGLIAASFSHVRNAAGEPHLHTHVLVANLTRAQGSWWAARGEDWFVNRSAAGALYQLELRHHLRAAGWDLDWRLRPDGLADLAGVPRSAVRATSSQAARVAAHGRYEARRAAMVVPWRARAAEAGFTRISPIGGRDGGRDDSSGINHTTERAVTARLGAARSDFRRADVIVALAACHPGGATVAQADEFVDRVCASARAVPSPTSTARWSTAAAARLDDQLERLLGEMARAPGRAAVSAPGAGPIPAGPIPDAPAAGGRAAVAVRHVLSAPGGVVHLGAPIGSGALLAQAEVLDACRAAWTVAGLTAGVDSPPEAAPRWALLAGLDRIGPGHPPDVVVVDRADRRTTADLLRVAERARSSGSRLVLVHGGTMPRVSAPVSRGLATAAGSAGYVDPGPHHPWAPSLPSPPPHLRALAGPEQASPLTGREAAAALLDRWRPTLGPGAPVLVGLGLDEVTGLNRAARLVAGAPPPARRPPPGRRPDRPPLGPGDRVVVVHGRGGGPAPYGSFGAVRPGPTGPVVRWDDDRLPDSPLDDRLRRGLRPGWAVTPFLAARSGRPAMVLGPADAAGLDRSRVLASIERAGANRARALER